jgi:glycogen operon protein
MLSQGVPMLLAGDEMGRTQGGNNNAYCQDNEVSWLDWAAVDDDLLEFSSRLIAVRRAHRVFRRRRFFQGQPIMGEDIDDIGWFTPKGVPMSDDDWQTGSNRSIGVFLNGEALPGQGPRGERLVDDSFFVAFNASDDDEEFLLPDETYGIAWSVVLDTEPDDVRLGFPHRSDRIFTAGTPVRVAARSTVLLERLED